ncbi:hypothetical protein ANCCAN_14874, partial [Ancylostoma caninum]
LLSESVKEYFRQRRSEQRNWAELERRDEETDNNRNHALEHPIGDESSDGVASPPHDFPFVDIASVENDEAESNGNSQPTSNYGTMSIYERTLYYGMYVQHFGLSLEEIKRMEDLMGVLYGTPPPITYEGHVTKLYNSVLREYDRERYYFCCMCNEAMQVDQTACENEGCRIYGLSIKRAKRMQRIEVHVINMVPQLCDLLVQHVRSILEEHERLHRHGGAPDEDRSDIRCFAGYYERIETADEFSRRHLKILLSLSLDGFKPKRWFFDHSTDAEITTFGSLYQWTSSHFESHHRRLQININQTTTNSANLIIEKYLPSKKVRAFFNEECANASRPLLSLAEKFENKHLKRSTDVRELSQSR